MTLDMTALPAKLKEDAAEAWKGWFLSETGCQEVMDLAMAIAGVFIDQDSSTDEGDLQKKARTARTRLSRFLGGHTHEVVRWIGDSPNKYGEAMAYLVDESVDSLRARYKAHASGALGQAELDEEVLNYLPLRVAAGDRRWDVRQFFRPWFKKHNRLERLPPLPEAEPLSWRQVATFLDRTARAMERIDPQVVCYLTPVPRATFAVMGLEAERRTLATRLATQRVAYFVEEQPVFRLWAPTKPLERPPEDDKAMEMPLVFHPVDLEAIDAWLEGLQERYYINADEAARVREGLAYIQEGRLSKFEPSFLIYALREFPHQPGSDDGLYVARRLARWTRRELKEEVASPIAASWIDDGTTGEFFLRWMELAGSTRMPVDRDQLETCLGLESNNTRRISKQELLEGIEDFLQVDVEAAEDLSAAKGRLMQLVPDRTKYALEEEGLIEKKGKNRFELCTGLERLALLQLAIDLRPEDAARLNEAPAGVFAIIEEVISVAPPARIARWCDVLLAQEEPHTMAVNGVLAGIAARPDSAADVADELLVKLWSAAVILSFQVDGGVVKNLVRKGLQAFFPKGEVAQDALTNIVAKANVTCSTFILRERLPILDDPEGPLAMLLSEVEDMPWVSNVSLPDHFNALVTLFILFQVPYERGLGLASDDDGDNRLMQWRQRELELHFDTPFTHCEMGLHLARRGDMAARRDALMAERRWAREARPRLSDKELLRWWCDWADEAPETLSALEVFEADFQQAFAACMEDGQGALRFELQRAAEHSDLGQHIGEPLREALEALRSGSDAVLRYVQDREPGDVDTLMTWIAIMERPTWARAIGGHALGDGVGDGEERLRERWALLRHRALLYVARQDPQADLPPGFLEPLAESGDEDRLEERRRWALNHHEPTLVTWCAQEVDIPSLIDDLEGLGERAWPHLSGRQRANLLQSLPLGELSPRWWARGMELPLEPRMRFARRHGTLSQRQQVARHLLEKASASRLESVQTWVNLRREERPGDVAMEDTIQAFIDELPRAPLSGRQLKICGQLILLSTAKSRHVVELVPRYLETSMLLSARLWLDAGQSPEVDKLTPSFIQSWVPRERIEQLNRSQRRDLLDRLQRVDRRRLRHVERMAEEYELGDENRRELEAFLDKFWEEHAPELGEKVGEGA